MTYRRHLDHADLTETASIQDLETYVAPQVVRSWFVHLVLRRLKSMCDEGARSILQPPLLLSKIEPQRRTVSSPIPRRLSRQVVTISSARLQRQ